MERLLRVARALADPVRLQMLAMMAGGRACCSLPVDDQTPAGVCVCEFVEQLRMIQSRVSYHLRVLKDAGLVRETHRGRWTYYSIDREALRAYVDELTAAFDLQAGGRTGQDAGNGREIARRPARESAGAEPLPLVP